MPSALGIGLGLNFGKSQGFSPAALFAASEPGGWYDPSDLTTLFQDAAGTTPVTAVEQPVGLVLDKSKGLVRGVEMISNGDFSNGSSNWTLGTGVSVSSGAAVFTNVTHDTGLTQQSGNITGGGFIPGRTYEVTFTILNYTSGDFYLVWPFNGGARTGANGNFRFIGVATDQRFAIRSWLSSCNFSIDNISVRELPGSHLSQSTSTARPVLSARVNLLTMTEEFDNAAWSRAGLTAANTTATTDPLGGNTADILTSTGSPRALYVSFTGTVARYTASAYFKADTETQPTLFLVTLGNGLGGAATFNLTAVTYTVANYGSTTGTTATINAVGNGWYHCTVSVDLTAATYYYQVTLSSTPLSVYIWGADLRPSNAGVGLPAYQRVGAATYGVTNPTPASGNPDYDTTGFPLYLKFDGTDDFLQSSTITPGADKAQVFAGVRKTAGGNGCIYELSTNWNTNNGSLQSFSTNPGFDAASRGTAAVSGTTQVASVVAAVPATAVLAALHDIAGDLTAHRLNGAAAVNATGDKGTGNFDNYPLYVGRRGGTTLAFNGHLYSLILRFSATNLDAATIASTETWVNSKTGAY